MGQQSFKEHLKQNFGEIVSARSLFLPAGFLVCCFIMDRAHAIEIFFGLVSHVEIWLIWIGALAADALLRSIYWYRMERKPSYVKKMEEIDRWLADKKAKKEAAAKLKDGLSPETKE